MTTVGELQKLLEKCALDSPVVIEATSFEDNYRGIFTYIDGVRESGNYVPTVYIRCS